MDRTKASTTTPAPAAIAGRASRLFQNPALSLPGWTGSSLPLGSA